MQLASLERVLEVDLNIAFGGEVILSEFGVSHTDKSLKQGNGTECGIYIMKHMQHLSKKTTSPVEKFDSHTARMELALKIVLNESNDIQEEVKSKIQAFYHEYTDSNPKGSTKGTPIKLAFVRSPIKSPKDQRYSNKKQKAKNMTPNCPARRTRGAIKQ
ncbi:uncharacterized protein LOC133821355 [Humulus lupulus]|uniref:uncharacterized protein LOC133821355 n=1 Tax=Humulus lupulus TaxID=3486 RepID=UPI002B405EA9|nr:uncharacterized protein LOC133821355 [Humulus lupulus]XP_062109687.1 uncharacterized protein LOC133821355 [Humulus lupulus]